MLRFGQIDQKRYASCEFFAQFKVSVLEPEEVAPSLISSLLLARPTVEGTTAEILQVW